jgi:hypothetical protein
MKPTACVSLIAESTSKNRAELKTAKIFPSSANSILSEKHWPTDVEFDRKRNETDDW